MQNPMNMDIVTSELQENFPVIAGQDYTYCDVLFAGNDFKGNYLKYYFAITSQFNAIFIRDYTEKMVHVVQLTFTPTCFHLNDYHTARAAVSGESDNLRTPHLYLLAIGDDQGQAHVFKYDKNATSLKSDGENPNPKELAKTKFGMAYGAVTSVSLITKNDSVMMMVGTESGEIMNYCLKETIRDSIQM